MTASMTTNNKLGQDVLESVATLFKLAVRRFQAVHCVIYFISFTFVIV